MSKSTKAAGKSGVANKKKKATKKDSVSREIRLSPDNSSPVRIILEIIVKNDAATTTPKLQPANFLMANLNLAPGDEQGCPDNKFAWSFDKSTDVTIVSLAIGGFKQDLPADAGEFTTCILDPNDPPSITVVVLAKTETGGGRAALSLTLNTKKVYDEPRELDNKGHGVLSIMESVKLPV